MLWVIVVEFGLVNAIYAGAFSVLGPVVADWSTAIQEQVLAELLSRVAAYDALGSYALAPVGTTLAGPVAAALGNPVTLAGAAVVIFGATAITLTVPDIRRNTRRNRRPGPAASAAIAPHLRQRDLPAVNAGNCRLIFRSDCLARARGRPQY